MGFLSDWLRWAPVPPVPPSSAPPSPPVVADDAVPTPPRMLVAAAKRQSREEICQKMRDAKKVKSQEAQNREKLFGDRVVDLETISRGELLLQCMKRLDQDWSQTLVAELSGKSTKTLRAYHDVWKTCANLDTARFSPEEVQKNKEQSFLFHCDNKKPGRQYCEPLTKLDIKDTCAKIVAAGNSQLLGTQTEAFTHCILPNLLKEREAKNLNILAGADVIFQRSAAAISRFIHDVMPVKKNNVKKHVQSRTDAKKNPVGAFSFVALFPQLMRNVHISNIICIDAVSTELFGEANKGAWVTEEVAADLQKRRQAPKASDSGGQYRSFKVNLAMSLPPESLVSGCAIVADHEIDAICKINITPNLDIIFTPYCPKDEEDRANVDLSSLSVRIADCIYQSHLPRIAQRRDRMCEWARSHGHVDPELFRWVRILQDGDSGPLKKIMDCFSLDERHRNLLFGKVPNAQTNNIQINDLVVTHAIIHSAKDGYSSPSFKTMNEDRVRAAVAMYPGLRAALDKLQSYRNMSRNSRLSYRYAIAFLPSLLERAVTSAIVEDAFRVAGYHPYDPAKMMHNMWETFQHLSAAEAKDALDIAEGPLRVVGESRGVIFPLEVNAAIASSDILGAVVELPEVPPDYQMRRWNMQSTMDLSHAEVQQLHADRIVAAAQAEH
jgi:hypothetical protein